MRYRDRIGLYKAAVNRYSGFLEAVLWKLCGDRELFAEAMQYALLAIWKHCEKLGDQSGAYIYRIAQSSASTAWKKRSRGSGEQTNEKIVTDGPVEAAIAKDQIKAVRRGVSELPKKCGRAVMMRYLDEKEYDVIAAEIGCSVTSARSHVSRGIGILRKKLAKLV
jgi:RNA polymerase sigma factor (sigma-70 family)